VTSDKYARAIFFTHKVPLHNAMHDIRPSRIFLQGWSAARSGASTHGFPSKLGPKVPGGNPGIFSAVSHFKALS
jgi:hypothetical protein